MIRLIKISVLCAAPLIFWGCGGDSSDGRGTVMVTGVVKYNGTPVENATVTLVPEAAVGPAGTRKGAFGRTAKDGTFKLITFKPGDGALPGKYKVMVSKFEASVGNGTEDSEENYVPPEEEPIVKKTAMKTKSKFKSKSNINAVASNHPFQHREFLL